METTGGTEARKLTTGEVLALVAGRPDVAPHAYKVGAWVWAEFDTKPAAETIAWLKATGFRWNVKRMAWQHACGVWRRFDKSGDPRLRYGEVAVAEEVAA